MEPGSPPAEPAPVDGSPPSPSPAPAPAPKPALAYWANLLLLVALCLGTSLWFGTHLQPYADQVVILGGGVSLWALLRLGWTVVEKSTRADAWEFSRRFLSSTELSLVLVAGVVVVAVLCATTGSQYFEYDGPPTADARLVVRAVRDDATDRKLPLAQRASFPGGAALGPDDRERGRVFLWQLSETPLVCLLEKKGVPYEPRDCSVRPRHSTRLKVPGDFRLKSSHLVELIPSLEAFTQLPGKDAAPQAELSYRLRVLVNGKPVRAVEDLRKGIVFIGGALEEMAELRAMEPEAELRARAVSQYVARGVDPAQAEGPVAELVQNPTELATPHLEQGDKLTITVERIAGAPGATAAAPVDGYPLTVLVNDQKVQSIWLPALSSTH